MPVVSSISDLIGEDLNAVCFVMDYVEFHFNGPVLRALSNPMVSTSSGVWTFPESGPRDQLTTLIGLTVVQVSVRDEEAISLDFSNGSKLSVPLDYEHRTGPEAAHFVIGLGKDMRMSVW